MRPQDLRLRSRNGVNSFAPMRDTCRISTYLFLWIVWYHFPWGLEAASSLSDGSSSIQRSTRSSSVGLSHVPARYACTALTLSDRGGFSDGGTGFASGSCGVTPSAPVHDCGEHRCWVGLLVNRQRLRAFPTTR